MKNARTAFDQPEPQRGPRRRCQQPDTHSTRTAQRNGTGQVRCTKVRYRDHQQAVRALHRASNARAAQLADAGTTRRRETRTYECHRCHGHHLTSRETA